MDNIFSITVYTDIYYGTREKNVQQPVLKCIEMKKNRT